MERDQRRRCPRVRRRLRAARRAEHRRGPRRRRGRRLHGHRRHRQRRRPPAGRRAARERSRWASAPCAPPRDAVAVPRDRAARPQGEGRAGPGVGGRRRAHRAARRAGRPPRREARFVGRDDELAAARAALRPRRARGPAPPRHASSAQAGVGKSRLLRELGERLERRSPPPALREGRCLPYGSGIVYWALSEVAARRSAGSSTATPPTSPGRSCSSHVERAAGRGAGRARGEPAERKAALIARLLGIELAAGRCRAESADPSARARPSSPPCAR